MLRRLRQCVAICVAGLMASATLQGIYRVDEKLPLNEAVKKPYLDLFEFAKESQYGSREIQTARDGLKKGQEVCINTFKQKSSQYAKDVEQAQKQLKNKGISDAQRHDLHCKIQNLRTQQAQTDILIKHAIPIAYDNRRAKLDLVEQWPVKYKEMSMQLENGTYRNRRWGDIEDIGLGEIEPGQEKDINDGQDAIREMKTSGLMPKEIENKEVADYVSRVAQKVALHS